MRVVEVSVVCAAALQLVRSFVASWDLNCVCRATKPAGIRMQCMKLLSCWCFLFSFLSSLNFPGFFSRLRMIFLLFSSPACRVPSSSHPHVILSPLLSCSPFSAFLSLSFLHSSLRRPLLSSSSSLLSRPRVTSRSASSISLLSTQRQHRFWSELGEFSDYEICSDGWMRVSILVLWMLNTNLMRIDSGPRIQNKLSLSQSFVVSNRMTHAFVFRWHLFNSVFLTSVEKLLSPLCGSSGHKISGNCYCRLFLVLSLLLSSPAGLTSLSVWWLNCFCVSYFVSDEDFLWSGIIKLEGNEMSGFLVVLLSRCKLA